MKKKRKPNSKRGKKLLKDYAKFSTIAFQMTAVILLGLYGGIKLDEFLEVEFPIFTLILTFTGLGIALYYLFWQALK